LDVFLNSGSRSTLGGSTTTAFFVDHDDDDETVARVEIHAAAKASAASDRSMRRFRAAIVAGRRVVDLIGLVTRTAVNSVMPCFEKLSGKRSFDQGPVPGAGQHTKW